MTEMIREYRDLQREQRGESEALVTSAVPLTEAEQEALRTKLEKRFGRKMLLKCEVDPSLLGGIRVETEGRVLDGSLRARLQEMKEVMDS
jgi:F-type H+-transporting ATPase subunit delta